MRRKSLYRILGIVGLLLAGQLYSFGQCPGCVKNDTLCPTVGPLDGLSTTICGDTVALGRAAQTFEHDITIQMPSRFTIKQGDPFPIIGIPSPITFDIEIRRYTITSISGLPAGVSWECDSSANGCLYFPSFANKTACIRLCGMLDCDDAGIKDLQVNYTTVQRIDPTAFGGGGLPGGGLINFDSIPSDGSYGFTIAVDPSSSMPLEVVSNKPATIAEGETIELTATAGFSTYTWSTGETTSTLTAAPNGSTIYSVTVTDTSGCTYETTYSQTVIPIGTSVASIDGQFPLVEYFPNPVSDVLYLEYAQDATLVEVLDVQGKRIFTSTEAPSAINLSEEKPGMYFLRVTMNEQLTTHKILINPRY